MAAQDNSTNIKGLEAIFDTFDHVSLSEKEIDNELNSIGINPDSVVQFGQNQFGRLQAKMRLKSAEKRKGLIKIAKEKLKSYSTKTDKPIEMLLNIFASRKQSELSGFFSKIKSLDDDEAIDMLDEAALLNIIDTIDEETD